MNLVRSITRRFKRRLAPTFLILGAEKGGTTSFFHQLGQHPRIRNPRVKEICYFDREATYSRGTDWYHAHFPTVPLWSTLLTFEATPSYIFYPDVPARVAAYNPKMRLIVMLRDPIDRAYSAWNMHRQIRVKNWDVVLQLLSTQPDSVRLPMLDYYELVGRTDFTGTVRQLISQIGDDRVEPGLLKRGFYARQIARYLQHFPKEQLLVLESAACRADPEGELNRVTDFLKIERTRWDGSNVSETSHHKRVYEGPMPEEAEQMLRDLYRQPNEELFTLLGRRYEWKA